MSEIRSFEDLECWKKGRILKKEISKLIKIFPSFEKYELVSQMRRASRSVTHNISEGYGRYHFKENAQFCRIARGSLYEIIDQLITANDDEYISDEEFLELKSMTIECITILNGYINYLVKNANKK